MYVFTPMAGKGWQWAENKAIRNLESSVLAQIIFLKERDQDANSHAQWLGSMSAALDAEQRQELN